MLVLTSRILFNQYPISHWWILKRNNALLVLSDTLRRIINYRFLNCTSQHVSIIKKSPAKKTKYLISNLGSSPGRASTRTLLLETTIHRCSHLARNYSYRVLVYHIQFQATRRCSSPAIQIFIVQKRIDNSNLDFLISWYNQIGWISTYLSTSQLYKHSSSKKG
jgi:hypothetical protein